MSVTQLHEPLNRRHAIAGEIGEHLATFEADLGRALASGSRLVGFLPGAREQASISPVVGQDAIAKFVQSISHISQAMDHAVAGHENLEKTRRRFRVPAIAGGDKDQLPAAGRGQGSDGGAATLG